MTPASKESLLKSAGFRERTPTTEKQKAAYQALPAYHLHQLTLKERTVYAYKDEKAGVVGYQGPVHQVGLRKVDGVGDRRDGRHAMSLCSGW